MGHASESRSVVRQRGLRLDRLEVLPLPGPSAASSQRGKPGSRGSAGSVVGWCVFPGCSEGFPSWERHVLHYKQRHLKQSDAESFCSLCLARVFSHRCHTLLHADAGLDCTQNHCSASFVHPWALREHLAEFHRPPPKTSTAVPPAPAATAAISAKFRPLPAALPVAAISVPPRVATTGVGTTSRERMEARSPVEMTPTQPVVAIARVGTTSVQPVGTTATQPAVAIARVGTTSVQPDGTTSTQPVGTTSTQPVVVVTRIGTTAMRPPAAVRQVGKTLTRPVAAVTRAGANNYVQPMPAVTPVGVTPTPPAGTPTGTGTATSGQPVAAGTPDGATSGQPVSAVTLAGTTSIRPVVAVSQVGPTSVPPVAAVKLSGTTSVPPVAAVKLSGTTSVPPVAAVSQDRPTSGQPVAAATLAGRTAIAPLAAVSQDGPALGHPVAALTLAGKTPIQPGAVVTQAGATSTQLVSAELQVGTTSSEPAAATASSVGAAEVGDVIAVLGWCTFPGCSEDFASWAGYVEHCLQRHGRSLCPTCLNVHAAQHGDTDAKCALCSARFVDSQALRVHKNFFHRAFDSITSRKWHLRIQEARAVIGWCTFPHCGRAFLSWEEHVVHQKESHLAPTQDDTVCDLCLAVKPVAGLPDHLEAHRLWDAPCSLCAARFIADNTDHRQQFHHGTPDGKVAAVLGWCMDSGCESSFSRWQDHVQHFLLHHWTLDADLVCRVCLARFQSQDEAKEHLKDHASPGKQQFRCTSCPVGFLTLKHFRKHMSHFHGLWVSRFSP